MCLVAFSWKTHPDYPLVISANRDEFFSRQSQPLHLWESGFYGGKDLLSGGTWMGYHPNGRWSLLTNYRDFNKPINAKISRGKLVQSWLEGHISPAEYLSSIQENQEQYDGFNLLVSDGERLFYLSNYAPDILEVPPGIYGLSNGLLNEPWPKSELAKSQLEEVMKAEPGTSDLLHILKSTQTYPEEELPDTGVPIEMEKALSAQLIRMGGNYGTVSASAVVQHTSGLVQMKQRSFQWKAELYADVEVQFQLDKPKT
ncbi:NRDE family protein [Algoriphagus halophytocola]|uniref:NRDE family protein n=1 Tax=Algoriphagus halophytocola TaxID=2991499 RepID=A0ABY6MFK5_9BACT|nr:MULTISPECIES: NRDE family protein [unclassified Algoriphagus]UZD21116.1 NRDE family protein [Algoriphagus sp. TR-M5]WBL42284.1 NRDE family protein [Algoriphagus sp. TR-M9]